MTTKNMRISPEEYKAEIQRRGWTLRALSGRWGVSENWVSKIVRNSERAIHWDDALRGLPVLMPPAPRPAAAKKPVPKGK